MDDSGIGKLFRRLFGFPDGPHHRSRWDEREETPHPDVRNHPFGGESGRFPGGGGDLDSMFDHFHNDIWRNMESLHRQMDEMMRGFGAVEFPSDFAPPKRDDQMIPDAGPPNDPHNGFRIWFGTPSPFFRSGGDREKTNLREHMLKDDDLDNPSASQIRPALPEPSRPRIEGPHRPFFSTPKGWSEGVKKDTDLDGKLSDKEVVDMITKKSECPSPIPTPSQPRMSSWGKSVRITRIQGSDGKMEERRVIRDSQGREESSVTKALGDQTHTVTTVTEKDGHRETTETFHNMEEKDKNKFDAHWGSPSQTPGHPAPTLMPPSQIDTLDRDIFSKFFGRK